MQFAKDLINYFIVHYFNLNKPTLLSNLNEFKAIQIYFKQT